jgi:fumarylacetoacetase
MTANGAARSWVESANDPECGFPLTSLPWCVFCVSGEAHIGVGIGDCILDLHGCVEAGVLELPSHALRAACRSKELNALMALGSEAWGALRARVTRLLAEPKDADEYARVEQAVKLLVKQREVTFAMPASIGDYTDFYASAHHARRVGSLFRPQNPLLPNYVWVPIGYHGRASSIVLSGTAVRRPCGQRKGDDGVPVFSATEALDYEAEIGMFVGPGNALGEAIPIDEAEKQIFGLCVVNDWSARDVQSWEYQPLGPFLAKSFATSISPWVVPLEALAPYRVPGPERADDDPQPLEYLRSATAAMDGIDLVITVALRSGRMREAGW